MNIVTTIYKMVRIKFRLVFESKQNTGNRLQRWKRIFIFVKIDALD